MLLVNRRGPASIFRFEFGPGTYVGTFIHRRQGKYWMYVIFGVTRSIIGVNHT